MHCTCKSLILENRLYVGSCSRYPVHSWPLRFLCWAIGCRGLGHQKQSIKYICCHLFLAGCFLVRTWIRVLYQFQCHLGLLGHLVAHQCHQCLHCYHHCHLNKVKKKQNEVRVLVVQQQFAIRPRHHHLNENWGLDFRNRVLIRPLRLWCTIVTDRFLTLTCLFTSFAFIPDIK